MKRGIWYHLYTQKYLLIIFINSFQFIDYFFFSFLIFLSFSYYRYRYILVNFVYTTLDVARRYMEKRPVRIETIIKLPVLFFSQMLLLMHKIIEKKK